MLKSYFWRKDSIKKDPIKEYPIISVLIFNCRDVEWEELDGNQNIKEFLNLIKSRYNINRCYLEINNERVYLRNEYFVKLKSYVKDYNSLTIKINY